MTPISNKDRRRTWRLALNLTASVREPGGSNIPVRIVDISTHGCRVESLRSPIVGCILWLSIAGLEAKHTSVVWCKGDFAGLEFDTPLSGSVLASIVAAQHWRPETVAADLQDLAKRLKHFATGTGNADTNLLRFSKDCAVYALVHVLKSAERPATQFTPPQLTGSMIQQSVPGQQIEPGFSFRF
jgi:hypothetical protein